ncbi:zinc finger protein 436 isoform X2 [Bombina bombina]|uniref:zinc finger protein 436 isoform X2 n=1 Tax=Bombina bombina TaxID=8345 RepID=UPI00235AD4D6|nr:zinc finger protein 436 isoform X2 [Bombina bombina]
MMNKNKMAERFLTHALEIIYLLTGEEYTIVKKKNSHLGTIHQLTREVPIKCDDVAIYFSFEEWEYIEEHKEFYKDAILDTHQTCTKLGYTDCRSSDLYNEGRGSVSEADETEQGDNNINQVEIHSDLSAGDINPEIVLTLQTPKDESEMRQIEAPDQQISDNSSSGEAVVMVEEKEDLCVESQVVAEDPELCRDIKTELSLPLGEAVNNNLMFEEANMVAHSSAGTVSDNLILPQWLQEPYSGIHRKTTLPLRKGAAKMSKKVSHTNPQATPGEEKLYLCNECGKQFNFNSHLIRHQIVHTGKKPHVCNICGRHYGHKGDLIIHQRIHTGERLFTCNECGKHFAKKFSFVAHQLSHTGEKPFGCDVCGKQFASKQYLIIHQRSHTGERPHRCNDCGKHFISKTTLAAHLRSHMGEKPYECSECGKHFVSKTNLIAHQRTHTGERPHKCVECGKQFNTRYHLLRHQRIHAREKETYMSNDQYQISSQKTLEDTYDTGVAYMQNYQYQVSSHNTSDDTCERVESYMQNDLCQLFSYKTEYTCETEGVTYIQNDQYRVSSCNTSHDAHQRGVTYMQNDRM